MTSNVLGNWNAGFIENRDDEMAAIYLDVQPDVIALQEVSKRYRTRENNLMELVSSIYEEIIPPATNRSHVNSTPILYRKDRFLVVDRGYHFFQDGVCDNSKSLTWVILEERTTGKRFGFASTHFIHTSEEGRVIDGNQAKLICDGLSDFYGCPVFMGGDFNANRKTEAYRNLCELGFIDLHGLAPNAPTIKSYHPYPVLDEATKLYYPNPESADGDYLDSIDHLFFYGKEEMIPTVESYSLVTDERARIASDHYPVYVDLILRDEP